MVKSKSRIMVTVVGVLMATLPVACSKDASSAEKQECEERGGTWMEEAHDDLEARHCHMPEDSGT